MTVCGTNLLRGSHINRLGRQVASGVHAHPPILKAAVFALPAVAKRCMSLKRMLSVCMAKPWRPSIDDVDSISRGGPAKVRGTGSRRIPHRLNAEERTLYDLAKKKGYVAVRGTGYRKFRHGNPLPNIYRQWCDARVQPCVVVEQVAAGGSDCDRVVVDLAPLRLEDTTGVETLVRELAAEVGVRQVGYDQRPADALPFNILPPDEGTYDGSGDEENDSSADRAGGAAGASTSGGGTDRNGASGGPIPAVSEDDLQVLREAVAEQAATIRQLKEVQGLSNQSPDVQILVKKLQQLKADLAQAEAAAAAANTPAPPAPEEPNTTGQLQPAELASSAHHDPTVSQPDTSVSASTSSSSLSHSSSDEECPSSMTETAATPRRSPLEHYYSLPIWQIHAVPMFFEGSRTAAKEFASRAVKCVTEGLRKESPAGAAVTRAAR